MAAIAYWPSMALIKLKEILEQALITDVDVNDPARAGIVKIGSLQADPTRTIVSVEVHENDPDGEMNWHHGIVNRIGNDENPNGISAYMGTGRRRWNRRFTIRLLIFLRETGREESATIKGTVIGRIEQALVQYPALDGIVDDQGEYALNSAIISQNTTLTGDGKIPIWRCKIWVQYQTTRPGTI